MISTIRRGCPGFWNCSSFTALTLHAAKLSPRSENDSFQVECLASIRVIRDACLSSAVSSASWEMSSYAPSTSKIQMLSGPLSPLPGTFDPSLAVTMNSESCGKVSPLCVHLADFSIPPLGIPPLSVPPLSVKDEMWMSLPQNQISQSIPGHVASGSAWVFNNPIKDGVVIHKLRALEFYHGWPEVFWS